MRGGATISPRWPKPIGREDVDHARGQLGGVVLELDHRLGVERGAVVEVDLRRVLVRVQAFDRVDAVEVRGRAACPCRSSPGRSCSWRMTCLGTMMLPRTGPQRVLRVAELAVLALVRELKDAFNMSVRH